MSSRHDRVFAYMKKKYKNLLQRMKKFNRSIVGFIQKKAKFIIYTIMFLVGIAVIVLSFFAKENWANICAGVGTGVITSLIVSVVINAENSAREKRKKEEEKQYLLSGIIDASLDVYEDIIHRINEFIILTESKNNTVYRLYDDFTQYNNFEESLKELGISSCTEEMLSRLNTLFNFDNYRIDYLVTELNNLPKQEYFLKGLLTQEECDKLISNYQNDRYLEYSSKIMEFWNDKIIDKEKCIFFLRMTIYISSKTIACFSYAKKKAEAKEKFIGEMMNQLYFEEIYSKSDAYYEEQMERSEAEDQYYAEHPEEWEALEKRYTDMENETEEDRIFEDLYCCICGFSAYKIEDLLEKLDVSSAKVKKFFQSDEIQKGLKKNRNAKRAIANKFGKEIIKKYHRGIGR